jgi:hypothetical protein
MVAHAKQLALRVEVFLLQIVAIATVQVADGANRFDENLKFAGSFSNIHIFLSNHSTIYKH